MGIFETYSKRKKLQEKTGQPDVYKYDDLPQPLRVQIIHIWGTALGIYVHLSPYIYESPPASNKFWEFIHDTLCRELGKFALSDSGSNPYNPYKKCQHFLQQAKVDNALDLIDLSFKIIDNDVRKMDTFERKQSNITQMPDDAINELNHRFKEHSIGYQYIAGKIIKVDSQYVHAEVVRPAISLLQNVGFKGANEEFLKAHEHYRKGRNKEAIAEALKSFESTMKSICSIMQWKVPDNATAKPLIDACFSNGLIPPSLSSHFSSLRTTLESGLPTISNKMARHGQGQKPIDVPDNIAAYALHLTATNIVFLVESFLKFKK